MNEGFKLWNERWRLAALTREDAIRAALWAVIVGFTFVLFHFQGNTTDVRSSLKRNLLNNVLMIY